VCCSVLQCVAVCCNVLLYMTDSTDNATATPPKSFHSRTSIFWLQIQIEVKSQFEFVSRDTERSDFLDFGDVAFSMETLIQGGEDP